MNLQKLQEILNNSVSDDDNVAKAADHALAEFMGKDPKLLINLHLQNLMTKPLHQTVSGSILELKNLASRQVFDFSKIGDISYQKNLQSTLFAALERKDLEESDLNVLASLVPNIASRFVFKDGWVDYDKTLLAVCKRGSVGGLIALADSLNSRLLKFETHQDDIISILEASFRDIKLQYATLTALIAAANTADNDAPLRALGKNVTLLLKVCPVSELNSVVTKLFEFLGQKKDFFDADKTNLMAAIQDISNKKDILPRVKRLTASLLDLLK